LLAEPSWETHFVTTQGDPHDRRRCAVTLTDLGRRTAERAVRVAAQITEKMLAPLAAAEQQTILRLRRKLG
jgi:DNA-binding MarR family transcriptional regulator